MENNYWRPKPTIKQNWELAFFPGDRVICTVPDMFDWTIGKIGTVVEMPSSPSGLGVDFDDDLPTHSWPEESLEFSMMKGEQGK